jgi:hypothetical protein
LNAIAKRHCDLLIAKSFAPNPRAPKLAELFAVEDPVADNLLSVREYPTAPG